jgi:hypothetical protein
MAIFGVQALLACDGIGTDANGCDATISTDLGSHDDGETWHTEQLRADVEREG